jgi:hypothetical protein
MMDRLTYILVSIGVVALIFLITWLVNPSLLVSYSENLRGSTNPLYDKFGRLTPTPFLMLGVLLNQMNGISIPLILVSLIYICLIIGASWYVIRKNQEKPLIIYSFVMLSIFMILPRIKPYSFIVLAIPLYFLFKDCSYQIKILVLEVISLLPLFFWFYPEMYRVGTSIFLISDYVYTVSLILIFVIAFLLEFYKPVSSPATHS